MKQTREHAMLAATAVLLLALSAGHAVDAASAGGPTPPSARTGAPAAFALIPDSVQIRVEENLALHVEAGPLRAWRDTCSADARDALDFLLAWLPPSDLGAWRAEQIESDIDLALRTRRQAPWRDSMTDAIFYTYVLPQRVAQEPIQAWRSNLHDLIEPRVRNMDLRQAALEVNRFCREYATFIPTSSRDQGPLTTMERGLGRCEEEMIFYICAARSVGIPARPCYTPYWTASDDNHAWVEVWTGDGWHYLGACEPDVDLDRAWFTGPARRAGLVLSVAYGQGNFPQELVYSQKAGSTLINSTGVYTRPGTVRVEWADLRAGHTTGSGVTLDSIRADRARTPIHVQVFNSGALSELGEFPAGSDMLLGPGGYVATCEVEGKPLAARVDVRSGEVTSLVFNPALPEDARLAALATPFWLRIPVPPEPAAGPAGTRSAAPAVDSLTLRAHEDAIRRHLAERAAHSGLDSTLMAQMAGKMLAPDLRAVSEQLKMAGVRGPVWTAVLARAEGDTFTAMRDLILRMDDKDFLEADPSTALPAVREAVRMRSARSSSVPDSTWNDYVLSPRIDFQPCDLGLWLDLPLYTEGSLAKSPQEIHALFAERIHEAKPTRLGHLARPTETWRSGVATPSAARVALVGLMRRNGIPARIEPSRRWIEVWVDSAWIPVAPLDAASWNRREGAVERAYTEPARLQVSFLDLGAPMLQAEGWVHFRPARWEKGRFESPLIDFPVQDGHLDMPLEPGAWWLFGGQRNHEGSPRVLAHPFTAVSGQTTAFQLDLGIPPDERDRKDLAPRQLSAAAVRLCGVDQSKVGTSEPPSGSGPPSPSGTGSLVVLWVHASEPCRRTAEAVSRAEELCQRLGLELLSVQVTPAESEPGAELLPRAHGHAVITPEAMMADFELPDVGRLPLVAIVDSGGQTRLLLTGMQLAVGDLIGQSMKR
jgi:hypothetical protein